MVLPLDDTVSFPVYVVAVDGPEGLTYLRSNGSTGATAPKVWTARSNARRAAKGLRERGASTRVLTWRLVGHKAS